MGLLITATEEKKITINGTDIELPSVYARLEFAGRADGKKLEIAIATYASKIAFDNGATPTTTSCPQGNMNVDILPTEKQSIDTAHAYAKQGFEELGYSVDIVLAP